MKLIDDINSKIDGLLNSGYRLKIEFYLRRGVDLFRQRADLFILYSALYAISMPIGGFIISGPLSAGFFLVARRLDKGEEVIIDHFFEGFKHFLPLLLLTIVSGILIFIGFIAFVIPGIYLSVSYAFSIFFVIFSGMDFWEAMEASRKVTGKQWFGVLVLILVLGILNFLGTLAFGVGLFFTIPISFCALYAAFDDIVGV
jgi:uncharacterized membrane protein